MPCSLLDTCISGPPHTPLREALPSGRWLGSIGLAAVLTAQCLAPLQSAKPACKELQEHIEELTGSVSAEKRAELWALPHKRFYFMTPQTFKNDLMKGDIHVSAPVAATVAHVWVGLH
jgi:hypothetical protein